MTRVTKLPLLSWVAFQKLINYTLIDLFYLLDCNLTSHPCCPFSSQGVGLPGLAVSSSCCLTQLMPRGGKSFISWLVESGHVFLTCTVRHLLLGNSRANWSSWWNWSNWNKGRESLYKKHRHRNCFLTLSIIFTSSLLSPLLGGHGTTWTSRASWTCGQASKCPP